MENMEDHIIIYEYEFHCGTSSAETARRINDVLQNKPRERPETKVDVEELKAIVEADPSQTTSELAAGVGMRDKTVIIHLKQIGKVKSLNVMAESSSCQPPSVEEAADVETKPAAPLTAAQRARAERERLKARALRDARLVQRPTSCREAAIAPAMSALDSGGGFLLEEEDVAPAPPLTSRPAPIVHATEQPHCLTCERPFPQSFLFDNFDHHVCDECRDDDGEHALMTRTEAKTEFLLKDCDLDSRPPPLRYLRRRNPHSSRYGDMRLYLRTQVEARGLQVWGSEEELAAERERREEARARTRLQRDHKRLRALRLDVRSSLYDRQRDVHTHEFGAEAYDEAADQYSRVCTTCGHVETYEKM